MDKRVNFHLFLKNDWPTMNECVLPLHYKTRLPEEIAGCSPPFLENTQQPVAQSARYFAHIQSFFAGSTYLHAVVHTFKSTLPGQGRYGRFPSGYDTIDTTAVNSRLQETPVRRYKFKHLNSARRPRSGWVASSAPQQNRPTTRQGPNGTAVYEAPKPTACSQSQREAEVRQKEMLASIGMR